MNEQITGALFKRMVLHGAAVITAQKAGKTTVDISGKNGSSDSEAPDEI